MTREAECRKRIETVKEAYDMLGAKPEAVICDLLTDIALSLAQIADKVGCDYVEDREYRSVNDKMARQVTVYRAEPFIGGRGGE